MRGLISGGAWDLTTVDEEDGLPWKTLHNAIQEIHRQNASGLSFEELYRNAYNMVLHKFGDKLYSGLVETITAHLRSVAAEIAACRDDEFLAVLKDRWEKHKLSSIMIRDILMYMDRTYVVAQKKTNARFAATREQGGTLPAGSKGKVRPWPYPYP